MRRLWGTVLAAAAAATLAAAPASASERELVYRAGPFTLGGFETVRPKLIVRSPRLDGALVRMHARLVDARGNPVVVNRVMLHHVLFLNQGRFPGDRKPKCGTRFGEPFYGTGEEDETLLLPPGYGYPLRDGDRWKMQTMLMSHSPVRQRVFMEYRMTVEDQEPLEPVTPYWVRATRCRNEPSYNVVGGGTPGSVDRRENTWVAPQTGRIVAAGSHLHGGAYGISLLRRNCGDAPLLRSTPSYGLPEDAVYNVRPALHEPGPVNTTWFLSGEGIPIHKGEPIRVSSEYDAEHAHIGVMGVLHVYVARRRAAAAASSACPPLPDDISYVGTEKPTRPEPPRVVVPLTMLRGMEPVTLDHPEGRLWTYDSPRDRPVVAVEAGDFDKRNLSIAAGTTLTWRFSDDIGHKVSLANGPRALGSPTLSGGRTWRWAMNAPGTYQLFCYLHPMTMHQEVVVREPGAIEAPLPG